MSAAPIGYAQRANMTQARRAFGSGASILVTEHDNGSEIPVWPSSTTHNRETTTWSALHDQVLAWRNRYPRQTFYVYRATGAPCEEDEICALQQINETGNYGR